MIAPLPAIPGARTGMFEERWSQHENGIII